MTRLLGTMIIFSGVVLIVIGLLVMMSDGISWLGRLPGDIHIEGKRVSFYFPIVTCIAISIILTLIVHLLRR